MTLVDHFRGWRGTTASLCSVLSIFALWTAVAPPWGEFPLNDDWAYAWSVQQLLETGRLHVSQWTSATAISPVFVGALSVLLWGEFSFTALRLSTLVASIVGCVALYDLLRQLRVPPTGAWVGTLALAVNPVYIYLSYTFMSDVFFFVPMVLSLSSYVRGLKTRSSAWLLAGSCLAGLSYLARQLGVVLPVAAVASLVLKDRRIDWRLVLAAAVLPFAVFVGHTYWLTFVHGTPWGLKLNAIDNSLSALWNARAPLDIAWRVLASLMYVGLFSLPALLAVAPSVWTAREKHKRLLNLFFTWLAVLIPVVAVLFIVTDGYAMPYLSNVVNAAGMGPLTLPGEKAPVTPSWAFALATALAPFAGSALAAVATQALARFGDDSNATLLLGASALMALATLLIVVLWDEYLVVLIPAGLYLALRIEPIRRTGVILGLAACLAFFVYGARELSDYMAWNSARWSAASELVAQGVDPAHIDGGFEWIGWHEFNSALPAAIAQGHGRELFGWMRITPDRYRIAFSPIQGHALVDSVPYQGSFFNEAGAVFVLETR